MKDLFDREITYLRISVTDLCNLRCRYCMPEEGVCIRRHDEMMTEDEIVAAASASASLGIKKIRITGGEPLVKKNIVSICRRISAIEGISEVCLTTNGTLLPSMADDLKAAGVKRLNISMDTLDEDKYRYITRRGELKDALCGIKAALDAGFEKIKINAVLIGGFNDSEAAKLADLTMKYPIDVRFIELMPMYDSGDFGPEAFIEGAKVLAQLPQATALSEEDIPQGSTAKLYRLPGAQGNIGLIRPLSSHFCGTCNRLRITADGKVKPCLHSNAEYSIKGLSEDEMRKVLAEAILAKPKWHGEMSFTERTHTERNMNEIGG